MQTVFGGEIAMYTCGNRTKNTMNNVFWGFLKVFCLTFALGQKLCVTLQK